MNPILLATLLVSVTGLILGLGLAIASVVMAVPVDEKAEEIQAVLSGANCGACGFSGCAGYAEALSKGKTTDCSLCAPGGAEVACAVADIMGTSAGECKITVAMVMCNGTKENSGTMMNYTGDKSCKTASQLFGGPKSCNYGCLGYGDCMKVCENDAISICDGVARINPLACKGCKLCVKTCPKGIIEMVPLYETQAAVFCKNSSKGAITKKDCSVGCIGCMKCVRACENDAITVTNFLAHVDPEKCTGCGKCIEGCPEHCLKLVTPGGKATVKA